MTDPISPVDAAIAGLLELGPVRLKPKNNLGNYGAELTFGHDKKVKGHGPTPMLALKDLDSRVRARATKSLPSGE